MNPEGTHPARTNPALAPPAPAPLLPEDVAILYTWANIPGAAYRDFSAAREERRRRRSPGTEAPSNPLPSGTSSAAALEPVPAPEFSGYRTVYRPAATLNPRPRPNAPELLLQSDDQEDEAAPAWLYGRSIRNRGEPSASPSNLPSPSPQNALPLREKEQ